MARRAKEDIVGGSADAAELKPATSARIYDYFLGGTHNFPADRDAAKNIAERFPLTAALARNNRAFLRRAVRYVADAGVHQFLDIGSGIPTEGNVHEVAAEVTPNARVVYVDIDPVAVSESLEILDTTDCTTAILGDLRDPQTILAHRKVRSLLDFSQPIAVLLNAVLHFVPDDAQANKAVADLLATLAPGSYLVASHVSIDGQDIDDSDLEFVENTYKQQTTTPFQPRTRTQIAQFFTELEMVEPGLVWLPQWRAAPGDPTDFTDSPPTSSCLVGVGRLP
ncbi:SAM-dependent methyltransferase [Dactylosporangium sp. NPDC005572]|uniref:SAM-dependent methyltransferase n=1 Tax=Dactylosporangium sp. NPDC005572 TaxID=3156889 RepID=UPI0033AD365F